MSIHSGDPPSRGPAAGDPDVDRVLRMMALLRAKRLAKGLSLRKLSGMMGVDYTHLSRSERGETLPGLVILMRWCRALDMEVESLFRRSRD